MQLVRSIQKAAEDFGKDRDLLEACAGHTRQRRGAVADRDMRGELAEQRRRIHRNLGKAETQARNSVHRQQMPRMRRTAITTPAVFVELVENSQIFDDAVAQRDVKLQKISFFAQAGVANEIARVFPLEQVLAGRQWDGRLGGNIPVQFKVERVHWLFVPADPLRL